MNGVMKDLMMVVAGFGINAVLIATEVMHPIAPMHPQTQTQDY